MIKESKNNKILDYIQIQQYCKFIKIYEHINNRKLNANIISFLAIYDVQHFQIKVSAIQADPKYNG